MLQTSRELMGSEYINCSYILCPPFFLPPYYFAFKEFMKKEIEKIPESEILKKYPISNKLDGWYFSLTEVSNNVWEVKGSDLWGRKVQNSGIDPELILREAVKSAKELNV